MDAEEHSNQWTEVIHTRRPAPANESFGRVQLQGRGKTRYNAQSFIFLCFAIELVQHILVNPRTSDGEWGEWGGLSYTVFFFVIECIPRKAQHTTSAVPGTFLISGNEIPATKAPASVCGCVRSIRQQFSLSVRINCIAGIIIWWQPASRRNASLMIEHNSLRNVGGADTGPILMNELHRIWIHWRIPD